MKKLTTTLILLSSMTVMAQSLWNDVNTWLPDAIPVSSTNMIWDYGELVVPVGYNAECDKLDLTGNNLDSIANLPLITVYGHLIVHDHIDLESKNVTGGVRSTKIVIAEGGVMTIIGATIHWQGNATALDSRVIEVNGTLNIHPKFNLDDGNGATLRIGPNGVVNLLYENGYNGNEIINKGTNGVTDFSPTGRINFAATTGDQNFSNSMVYPNVGVTGGQTLFLKTGLDSSTLEGNLIAENGTMDIEAQIVTGNQTNKIVVDSTGTFKIGGTNTFPASTGAANEFLAPDLKKYSTVEYDGETTQNIAGHNYWNLTLSDEDLGSDATRYPVNNPTVAGILSVVDNSTLNTTSNYITILSTGDNADESGMIGPVTGTISGDKVIVQRDMDLTAEPDNRYGWNDWCSPIVGNALKSWADCCIRTTGFSGSTQPWLNFNSALYYDASLIVTDKNDGGWVGATSINNQTGLGTGMRLYEGNFDNTFADTGAVHVGDITVNLNYKFINDYDQEGWNLMGNPYACPIEWSSIYSTGINGSVVDAVWMYSNAHGYYTYNGMLGIGSGLFIVDGVELTNDLIPAHKAFWVKADALGASITFKETHKNTGGAYYLKSNKVEPELVRVQIESEMNGYKSSGVLAFHADASEALDALDSEFLQNPAGQSPSIAFQETSGMYLTINAVPNTQGFQEIPMYVKAGAAGQYNLRFYDLDKLSEARCISLIDTETNMTYNIRETSLIAVELNSNTATDRFKLVVGSPLQVEKTNDITCFGNNNGEIAITWEAGVNDYYQVTKDGEMMEASLNNSTTLSNLSGGVYTITPIQEMGYCAGVNMTYTIVEPKEVVAAMVAISIVEAGEAITFYNMSTGSAFYNWNFGDGNQNEEEVATHTFQEAGIYQVALTVMSENGMCADQSTQQVVVTPKSTVSVDEQAANSQEPYQLIANEIGYQVVWNANGSEPVNMDLRNVNGQLVAHYTMDNNQGEQLTISTEALSQGMYVLTMQNGVDYYTQKLTK